MRLKKRQIKYDEWRVELWKYTVLNSARDHIVDENDPSNDFVREYSLGFNDGLRMAHSWFVKYVERKEDS